MDLYPAGWTCLGQFPLGDPDGVGSWILSHEGEAALLEIPPGLQIKIVRAALRGLRLKYAFASHHHWDHFDKPVWARLQGNFPKTIFLPPKRIKAPWVERLELGGEPLFRVHAPKHSWSDSLTIFRGFAMTGDIEMGQLESCNRDVPADVRQASMDFMARFETDHGYQVAATQSAHLNDPRRDVDFSGLFRLPPG